jgi:hypothetical protein
MHQIAQAPQRPAHCAERTITIVQEVCCPPTEWESFKYPVGEEPGTPPSLAPPFFLLGSFLILHTGDSYHFHLSLALGWVPEKSTLRPMM